MNTYRKVWMTPIRFEFVKSSYGRYGMREAVAAFLVLVFMVAITLGIMKIVQKDHFIFNKGCLTKTSECGNTKVKNVR